MNKKNILIYAFLAFVLASCKPEAEIALELTLENTEITLSEGEGGTITITSGNGGYVLASSNEAVATATIAATNKITITTKSFGTTTITITDGADQRASIKVTVTAGALRDTKLRIEWDEQTIVLDELHDWSIVQNHQGVGNIGIVNLSQRKSLRTSGINNYNVDVKSSVRLYIVENGGTEQAISLDKFEIVENRDGIFTAVGNAGDKKLVIRYKVN
jgi:flagellar basal body rod protein FlgG